jgi:hypothetical protein
VHRSADIVRSQSITFTAPEAARVGDRPATLAARSSSGLRVEIVSQTPLVCNVLDGQPIWLAAGECRLSAVQRGTRLIAPARVDRVISVRMPNAVFFALPRAAVMEMGSLPLVAFAMSGQEVDFLAAPAAICRVEAGRLRLLSPGACRVTAYQAPSETHAAASPVTRTVHVVDGRSTTDRPDLRSGYQLHFVYVVPNDQADRMLDISGAIHEWIDAGNAFWERQTGLRFPIDESSTGYDITYLNSRHTTADLSTSRGVSTMCTTGAIGLLLKEIGAPCIETPEETPAGKHYVFLIDAPTLGGSCGFSFIPHNAAIVVVGRDRDDDTGRAVFGCETGRYGFDSFTPLVWVHEVLHGLGVEHAPVGTCDLMQPSGGCVSGVVVDPDRSLYLGASALGVDLLEFDFWIRKPA